MARIEIHFPETEAVQASLTALLRDLEAVEGALRGLTGQVSPAIQARHGIGPRLRACAREAEALRAGAGQLRQALQRGARAYREAERDLERGVPDGGDSIIRGGRDG